MHDLFITNLKLDNMNNAAKHSSFILKLVPLFSAGVIELLLSALSFAIRGDSLGASLPFSIPRFFLLLVLFYSVYLFRPDSKLYTLDLHGTRSATITLIVVALLAALLFAIPFHFADDARFEPGFTKYDGAVYDDAQQYNYLANSIIAGHAYLDLEVPSYLIEMNNPYDASERSRLAKETGEPYYWDYAYYNGHYYCYFGALPALTLFVPFKLLTGADLPNYWAVALSAVLFCLAIAFFLRSFLLAFFPETPLALFLLLFLLFVAGSEVTIQVLYPLFYSLPPIWSLIMIALGLGLWMHAKHAGLNKVLLAMGSICMALTLECRPQTFLFVLLAIPLFWKEIREDRLFFSKKGLGNTAAVLLPCIIVGALAMAYNNVRFGSPFDFGASYNLTGFDMTAKTQALSINPLLYAIAFYLLTPLMLKPAFPYITTSPWHPMPVEPFTGGFFAYNPSALALFALPFVRKPLQQKGLWGLSLTSIILSIALMVMSTYVASISMRYISDFAIGLLLPTACVWLSFIEQSGSIRKRRLVIWVFAILVITGAFLSFFNLLAIEHYGSFAGSNPWLYSLAQQWLAL